MPQAQSVSLPKRWPLITEPGNRGAEIGYDEHLVNCYVEARKTLEGPEYWLYKRPGLLEQSRPSGGVATGLGVYNWRGDIYAVFDNKVYKNGVALAGTVNTAGGLYKFKENLGATPHLQLGNGAAAYQYDSGAGLVQITDGDFPAAFVKGWSFLDGTTYVMKENAHIQGSDLNDASSWDPLNDIMAQIEADLGVALAKQLVYTIAFKQWSTEVFYDAGNATGSPLGQVQGAKVSYGCVNSMTVQDIDGALLWVCASKTAGTQVGRLEQLKFEIISTKPIERILQTADWTTAFSYQLSINGHRFYCVTSKVSNFTLAFDLDEQLWHQWVDVNANYMPVVDSTYDSSRRAIFQHETDGRLYFVSDAYTNDNGSLITSDLITPNFDAGVQSRGKYLPRMFFVADQTLGSTLQVRCNDHDYDPTKWTNFRLVDLSKKLPYLSDCGTFNRRAYHFRHASNTKMRLKAVELQMDLCTLPAWAG